MTIIGGLKYWVARTWKNIGIATIPKAEIQQPRKGAVPTRAEVLTFWGGYDHSSLDGRKVVVLPHLSWKTAENPPSRVAKLFLGKCLTGGIPLQNHPGGGCSGEAAGQEVLKKLHELQELGTEEAACAIGAEQWRSSQQPGSKMPFFSSSHYWQSLISHWLAKKK